MPPAAGSAGSEWGSFGGAGTTLTPTVAGQYNSSAMGGMQYAAATPYAQYHAHQSPVGAPMSTPYVQTPSYGQQPTPVAFYSQGKNSLYHQLKSAEKEREEQIRQREEKRREEMAMKQKKDTQKKMFNDLNW